MKLVKAIIGNANNSSKWEEEFKMPEGIDEKQYIEKIVENFNNTLRPGERPRKLIEILNIEAIEDPPEEDDDSDFTDEDDYLLQNDDE